MHARFTEILKRPSVVHLPSPVVDDWRDLMILASLPVFSRSIRQIRSRCMTDVTPPRDDPGSRVPWLTPSFRPHPTIRKGRSQFLVHWVGSSRKVFTLGQKLTAVGSQGNTSGYLEANILTSVR